jgi:hypothetical protein
MPRLAAFAVDPFDTAAGTARVSVPVDRRATSGVDALAKMRTRRCSESRF